ncbi:MAG: hypothetical protein M5T61_17460 [Acidimicrobiia bacterium]|nr:hypothetical protein [Acidimicrobiia bacterium]
MSLDYLLIDDAPRRPLEVTVSRLAERVMGLGTLSEEDERALLHILDSLEARSKLKELAAGVG